MSEHFDPELNEILGDPELLKVARLLSNKTAPEPPLDDAFKSALRRQLMAEAWRTAEGRNAWWRKLFSPPGMAWAAAAAVVVIAASVVFYTASLPPSGFTQTVDLTSPQQDASSVPLHQAILVSFNQAMDHPSTEAAVQVTPATTVAFRWSGDKALYVQPASGNLAPNTQYQVTIGPGAKTQTGTKLDTPKSITFVTQPVPSPAAPPSPSPRPSALNQAQLTTAYPPSGGTTYAPLWSADSAIVYFVAGGGALDSVPAAGGQVKTLVAGGVSLPAIAAAGDRLAYVRGGHIEILTIATGATSELNPASAPTTLAWVKDQLQWGTADGIYSQAPGGPSKIASVPPPNDATAVISIAPDGAHAAYTASNGLFLLDTASGKTVALGAGESSPSFQGWSPDGSRVIYGSVIADLSGRTITSLPAATVSWSAKNVLLLGSDTSLFEMLPDGTGLNKLADGTYNAPVWAPNGSTFVFLRSGLYVGTAPPAPPVPAVTDQALVVVDGFMKSRLLGNADRALLFLDDAGKAAYNSGTPLIPTGDTPFKRYYVLTSEVDPSSSNAVRVVVRMVFAKGKVEKTTVEETLTLKRAEATDPFLIDAVSVAAPRDVGKGPEVVTVKVTSTEVNVTFDSDLVQQTLTGVTLQDANGMALAATPTYADRTVTFAGLQLTPGAHYRLVVLPTVLDVGSRHAASEYDLDLVGPATAPTAGGATPTPAPSQGPQPAVSPTPAAS